MRDLLYKLIGATGERRDAQLRTWLVLTGGSALATAAVLPYALQMSASRIEKARQAALRAGKPLPEPPPLPVLMGLGVVQSTILFGLVAALGLRTGRAQGLGAPHLEALLNGEPAGLDPQDVAAYAAAGAAGAGGIILLEYTLFHDLHEQLNDGGMGDPGGWKGLLASTYGAIAEEVMMRLGLQTFLSAGIRRLRGETGRPVHPATMWSAVVLANVGFGLGHLPAMVGSVPITGRLALRAVVLNGLVGLILGYLYWRHGLEAAITAHGSADLVLHVLLPAIDRRS